MRAPVKDPKGRRTLVKFARKTKQQYITSQKKDGKQTNWRADFVDGNWIEQETRKKRSAK